MGQCSQGSITRGAVCRPSERRHETGNWIASRRRNGKGAQEEQADETKARSTRIMEKRGLVMSGRRSITGRSGTTPETKLGKGTAPCPKRSPRTKSFPVMIGGVESHFLSLHTGRASACLVKSNRPKGRTRAFAFANLTQKTSKTRDKKPQSNT